MANYTQTSSLSAIHYPPLKEKVECEKENITMENCKSIILSTFPQVGKFVGFPLYQHKEQNWCARLETMAASMTAQKHFTARPTDIIIATFPRSGTTWTKALVFTIINRHSGLLNCSHALNVLNPHQLVPFLELDVYGNGKILDVESIPSPRVLSTHLPYQALPRSILDSNSRIICVSRDPKDVFVSHWHFIKHLSEKSGLGETSMEETFQSWCSGFSLRGSYWDHVQGYRNNSSNNKVLFLKYEDMMEEPIKNLKRLAEFVGQPFTVEEEKEGVADQIIHLCSFNNLKNKEVNKSEITRTVTAFRYENSCFFRKGKVGDFRNHLTPEMVERIDHIAKEKLSGSDPNVLRSI